MALRILQTLGYPYEYLPIICALVKLANKNETAIREAINEGENNYN